MPSAREKARDNASSRLMDAYQEGLPISWGNIESAADAASEVWEPIVSKLVATVESRLESLAFAPPEMFNFHVGLIREALAEAKEALG